jgi:hypothetical protein
MIEIRFTCAPVRIEPILTDRDTPSAFLRILSNKHEIGEISILSRCIMGSRLFRSRISPILLNRAKRPRRSSSLIGGSPLFERPDFRTSQVADSAPMPCARRAGGGRRARLRTAPAGLPLRRRRRPVARDAVQECPSSGKVVKFAVDDNEAGAAHECASRDCKPCR